MTFNPKKNTRNNFKKMTINLVCFEEDKFDFNELIHVLGQVTFNLININLSTAKENVGIKGNGFAPIGFVNRFYVNEAGVWAFDVAISSRYIAAVDQMEKESDLGISARVFTNKEGKITKIVGLDLNMVG